jgi:hypothetical protein
VSVHFRSLSHFFFFLRLCPFQLTPSPRLYTPPRILYHLHGSQRTVQVLTRGTKKAGGIRGGSVEWSLLLRARLRPCLVPFLLVSLARPSLCFRLCLSYSPVVRFISCINGCVFPIYSFLLCCFSVCSQPLPGAVWESAGTAATHERGEPHAPRPCADSRKETSDAETGTAELNLQRARFVPYSAPLLPLIHTLPFSLPLTIAISQAKFLDPLRASSSRSGSRGSCL